MIELEVTQGNRKRGVSITRKPAVNLLSQEEFRERAELIFSIMDEILGRSYGPYGAATLISDFPYVHATKDGFRIAREITFDHITGSPIDRVIAKMAMDICGRLNYAVGDGTTTAILATNQLFRKVKDIMPDTYSAKEFIDVMQSVKAKIVENLESYTTPINEENITDVIKKITMVSSNGDAAVSNMITEVYEKYKYPIIRCDVSDGPDTYLDITEGYKCKVRLGDNLYINTSRRTGEYLRPFVLIFDHQIRVATYREIIEPLYSFCRNNGASLVVVAPSYDEVALNNHIKRDVLAEYRVEKRASLIITAYPKNNKSDAASIYDLAMLTDTSVIDRSIEEEILSRLDKTSSDYAPIHHILEIPGVTISATNAGNPEIPKFILRIGRADKFIGAEKESIFMVSGYDQGLYDKMLNDAKNALDDTIRKYEILGTFTSEVYDAQYRYVSLLMKTAVIYVGGDSELSRNMRADAVEDAIRAAESAFRYGYVLGGSISTIKAIKEVVYYTYDASDLEKKIADAFMSAFQAVYMRVFDNSPKSYQGTIEDIVDRCITENKVFDVTTGSYNADIINSVKTDIEVLTATIDLLSILLTGNQLIIARYQHEPIKE